MSIKIHHGPDGTFKTSGAIKDDILKIVKTGRMLVTNVRGFSKERTIEILGEENVHPDFDVISVDTETQEGRDHLARFFHWAPKGAFFVIDEVQRIYHPKLTEKQLEAFNYDVDQSHLPENEQRPENIHVAWDMQRHHNWDFIFTTTHISKVHPMCRVMAKVAVRHVNMGIWRFYKTVEHSPESNGRTQSDITTMRLFNYVPKQVFDLYASTKTGSFENTEPRTSVFKNPKVVAILFFIGLLGIYIASRPSIMAGNEAAQTVNEVSEENRALEPSKDAIPTNNNSRHSGENISFSGFTNKLDGVAKHYLSQFQKLYISGYVKGSSTDNIIFVGYSDSQEYQFSSSELKNYGILAYLVSDCTAKLFFEKSVQYVFCQPRKVREAEKQGLNIPQAL
jgi:zona occludens toxin (predicted ATPase)